MQMNARHCFANNYLSLLLVGLSNHEHWCELTSQAMVVHVAQVTSNDEKKHAAIIL